MSDIPILQFDPEREAVIHPGHGIEPVPDANGLALSFFSETVEELAARESLSVVGSIRTEMGKHRVYQIEREGQSLGLFQVGVGAPLAAAQLDQLLAMGYRNVIVCGSAGVLDSEIEFAQVMICESAVRDEGTSYHYLPAGEEALADSTAVETLDATLEERGVAHFRGKSWTTDGFYRETPGKVARRRSEGCSMVEMEAAALFAVASYRGARIGQLLYAGDDVSGLEWDPRSWGDRRHAIRAELIELSLVAAATLARRPG